MVLRTQSGPATLSSQGALLPRGSVLTPRSPGCSLGGATGTGHGSGLHSGHDKEPFSSGTSRHSEPPSAHGTRLPHSRPSQWPAVRLRCGPNCSPVWAHSGAWAGPAQAERSQELLSPRRKVLRALQGGGRGPGPLVSLRITQAQPQGEGLRLQVVNRELPFIQALLQGPSKPLSLSKCRRPALKTGKATASGPVMAARWQRG